LVDKKDNLYLIFGRELVIDEMRKGVYFKKGDLVIMASTAKANWKDWEVIHTEKGTFMNEMLAVVRL
jgi:hypothetical protein